MREIFILRSYIFGRAFWLSKTSHPVAFREEVGGGGRKGKSQTGVHPRVLARSFARCHRLN